MEIVLTFALACACTVFFIVVSKTLAHRVGLIDRPNSRKSHEGEIPLVGGISIFLGFIVCLLWLGKVEPLAVLLLAGGILVVVGAFDDATELSHILRLILHAASALMVCLFGGVVVVSLGPILISGDNVNLGPFAIPFTVFAIVAMTNAVNMSDGLDGLCATQTLIPLAGLAVVSYFADNQAHLFPLVALCGCLCGFLYFNLRSPFRNKASVFLGDAGSSFLGFVLAWFLIDMSQGENAVITPVSALWFALLTIYSTVEIVTRRIVRKRSPFKPDAEHFHHVFVLAGFTVNETVFTLATFTVTGVLIAIAATVLQLPQNVLFITFVVFGLMFLSLVIRTWRGMQFLYRSICRRKVERRQNTDAAWGASDRRKGGDRRRERAEPKGR